jgi:structural maintenance of chromosome 3 (chondroitin sulfate proteoglycan 6)
LAARADDKRHAAAVEQVFGRVLLCRSLEVAAAFAKQDLGLTCITLDGDMVNKKGAVQGGYREAAASRLAHAGATAAAHAEIASATAELAVAQSAALNADQRMSQLRGDEQRVSSERSAARDTLRRLQQDVERCAREVDACAKAEEAAKAAAGAARMAAEALRAREAALAAEMAGELTSALSAAEAEQLNELTARGDALKAQLQAAAGALEAARAAASQLQSELDLKLLRREAEIASVLGGGGGSSGGGGGGGGPRSEGAGSALAASADDLRAATAELSAAKAAEESAAKAAADCDAALAAAAEALAAKRSGLDALRAEAARVAEAIAGESVHTERVTERRRTALRKKEECAARLRDVGTLPSGEIDAWSSKRKRDLVVKLSETNEALKAYSHVNKKVRARARARAGCGAANRATRCQPLTRETRPAPPPRALRATHPPCRPRTSSPRSRASARRCWSAWRSWTAPTRPSATWSRRWTRARTKPSRAPSRASPAPLSRCVPTAAGGGGGGTVGAE